jgi:hypothetical protein
MRLASKERYRASAAQKRAYGGSTVTVFWAMPTSDPKTWFEVTGFGRYPGNRKSDAMAKAVAILARKRGEV